MKYTRSEPICKVVRDGIPTVEEQEYLQPAWVEGQEIPEHFWWEPAASDELEITEISDPSDELTIEERGL